MANTIKTFSGINFNLDEFNPDEVVIEDIAHALSLSTRYGGHCRRLYSIAQHSVWCSIQEGRYPMHRLMHDAAEAYMGDIVTPLKVQLPNYREKEDKLMDIIYKKFCPVVFNEMLMNSEVKMVDRMALTYEQSFLWDDVKCSQLCWSTEKSEYEFLKMFENLI